MLVLARRIDEGIVLLVGDVEVRVKPTRIRGGQIWLGIEAPPEVAIYRDELLSPIGRQAELEAVA